MPDTVEEWLWFITTAVILAVILSVIGNLLTPPIKKLLDDNIEQRRQKRLAKNTADYKLVLESLKKIEEDKSLLVVMAHKAAKNESIAMGLRNLGLCIITIGAVTLITTSSFTYGEIGMGRIIAGALSLLLGVFIVEMGSRVREDGEIYDLIARAYEMRDRIPPPNE